jgi:hypothetical protein
LIEAAVAGKRIHRFSPEPYPESIALSWHELVPWLSDRAAFAEALSEPPADSTDGALADWARARFLLAEDPLDAIADCIARMHDAGEAGVTCLPRENGPLWDGEGTTQAGDVFTEEDVALRVGRWRSTLGD